MLARWRLLLLAALAVAPTAPLAQTPPPVVTPPAAAPAAPRPPLPLAVLTEGQPIDARPTEKADDKPAFPGQTRAPYHASVPVHVDTLTTKLSHPWSLAFLPDGKILVTEKTGALRTVDAQGAISDPIAGVPAVLYRGEVGLLDVVLDPDFAKTRRLYLSYNEPAGDDNSTIAVASARLDAGDKELSDVTVIFHAFPALSAKTMSGEQGGRLALKGGLLYLTLGDRAKLSGDSPAQALDSDLGKIVRITTDGQPAPGNPFIGKAGARPEIFTLGHRNAEGLAFDARGQLWEIEHGPKGGDELDKIAAGKNYGWPLVAHGLEDNGKPIGEGLTEKPGLEPPRYYWDPVIAPSGLAFYTGALFPAWNGSALIGALRGQMLDRLTLVGDKVVAEEPLLRDLRTRIRDVRVGPEGAVYVLTDGGALLRVTPG